jgi:hypothetical protein
LLEVFNLFDIAEEELGDDGLFEDEHNEDVDMLFVFTVFKIFFSLLLILLPLLLPSSFVFDSSNLYSRDFHSGLKNEKSRNSS